MTITDYILTYDDVRALLGVSKKELKDETIGLQVYALQLEGGLDGLHSSILTMYSDLQEKKRLNEEDPVANPPLTKTEKKMLGTTQVYSTYSVAVMLVKSLPIFGVKRVTDGKAEMERMPTAFDNLQQELEGLLGTLEDELLGILEDLGETVTPVANTYFIGTAELGVDPVTGA